MSDAPARRLLGLPKLTKVRHRVFTLLFSLRNRDDGPSKSNDSLFESHANAKERKGEGSFCSKKVSRPRRAGREKGRGSRTQLQILTKND